MSYTGISPGGWQGRGSILGSLEHEQCELLMRTRTGLRRRLPDTMKDMEARDFSE